MATVQVEEALYVKLMKLSETEHRPISQVIAEAIDRYERETFWTAMHESFARLRADPGRWADYLDEAAAWDSLSGDGLETERPYFSDRSADPV